MFKQICTICSTIVGVLYFIGNLAVISELLHDWMNTYDPKSRTMHVNLSCLYYILISTYFMNIILMIAVIWQTCCKPLCCNDDGIRSNSYSLSAYHDSHGPLS